MFLSEANFRGLLRHLKEGFEIITLDAFLSGTFPQSPTPLCLLTFDDGWEDNFSTAYPLLRKENVPAAIFLATGVVDDKSTFWVERLLQAVRREGWPAVCSRLASVDGVLGTSGDVESLVESLKHRPARQREQILASVLSADSAGPNGDSMMTWENAVAMVRNGIAFGAHTVTHPLLTFESPEDVARELAEAKTKIESALGHPVQAFAYPNGDWNPEVRGAVVAAGYRCAFQVQRGWYTRGDDMFTIRRVFLHDGAVAGWNGKFSPAMFQWTVNR
jgi:peptidoglycan/xylan/chitin deacetylase (PgdA/CDA1 family)